MYQAKCTWCGRRRGFLPAFDANMIDVRYVVRRGHVPPAAGVLVCPHCDHTPASVMPRESSVLDIGECDC